MIAASAFIFTGCTKTGPRGATGATGATGPQGPQGNANVIPSAPFTVSSWSASGATYTASFTSNDITSDIVDNGMVMVYKSYGTSGAPRWSPLPDVDGNVSTVFDFYDGGFQIYVQTSDGSMPPFPGSVTFRMVVVSSALRKANPNTDWKNYEQAMAAIQGSRNTVSN